MSEVWVELSEAQRGSLPPRCAKTGQRCITRYRRRVGDLPAATEWVTWTGLWPRDRDTTPLAIVLPLLPSRHRAGVVLRRARDLSAALFPLALVLLAVVGGGLPGRLAAALAIGAVLIHLVVAVVGLTSTIDIRIDTTGRWVRLAGVHPEFITATEATTSRPEVTPEVDPVTVAGRKPDTISEAAGES